MVGHTRKLTRRTAIRGGMALTGLASVTGCQELLNGTGNSGGESGDEDEDGEAEDDTTEQLVSEGFDGSKPDNWAVLRDAAWGVDVDDGDREPSPALRLTDAVERQVGAGFHDQGYEFGDGFVVEFDFYAGGGTGADGLAVFAVDGDAVSASTIDLGKRGGSLGYAQGRRNFEDIDGLSNAYLGVGFDAIGNFARENDNQTGGTVDQQPASVGLRGEGDGQDGYAYLTHESVAAYGGIQGGWRRATVTLEPAEEGVDVGVEMSWDGGATVESVLEHTYETAPPASLKFGFSGATGGKTNRHVVDDVRIRRP